MKRIVIKSMVVLSLMMAGTMNTATLMANTVESQQVEETPQSARLVRKQRRLLLKRQRRLARLPRRPRRLARLRRRRSQRLSLHRKLLLRRVVLLRSRNPQLPMVLSGARMQLLPRGRRMYRSSTS
jgi:hypothetical protein